MDLLHAFGLVLKSLRKEKSLSQEELAYRSGLDRTYISLLERGLRNPTITTLFSITNCLNYETNQLIKDIELVLTQKSGSDNNETRKV